MNIEQMYELLKKLKEKEREDEEISRNPSMPREIDLRDPKVKKLIEDALLVVDPTLKEGEMGRVSPEDVSNEMRFKRIRNMIGK